ncbi:hypothetical protein [Calothrix sp. NIES-3974]|uniref:hypothetical protein n=1 Tax=Calothrix sp. NIES-3974 TaxID=2005462 RepID=UPI000B5E52DC|nr:hypothetical protein [Calothrix sp. NIES-3974]BAZ04389.1 hypothetical protein NIES3974_10270 [Calothrix sp. NIES-3974]
MFKKAPTAILSLGLTVILYGVLPTQAETFSTNPQNPTVLKSNTISGQILPTKGKKYYVTFLAGSGNIFFDVNIAPKDNKGAVFFWQVYRNATDAVKDNPLCTGNLYLEVEKKGDKCVITTPDKKPQAVLLSFGAYPNSDPVMLNYTIKLSGDWQALSDSATSAVDLSMRRAVYFATGYTKSVNTSTPYATPGQPITLNRANNKRCGKASCVYWAGVFIFRNSTAGNLKVPVKITSGGSSQTATVEFTDGSKIAELTKGITINNGTNKVVVEIDPDNKLGEANRQNNTLTVDVTLKP